MNAPKCRLCGREHWAREGCKLIQSADLPSSLQGVRGAERVVGRVALPCAECAAKDAAIRALQSWLDLLESRPKTTTANHLTLSNVGLTGVPLESNGKFDKRAYQREFMRADRARKRAARLAK